jgi:hypothetical protein
MLWHAFLFLGLSFFPLFSFCLVDSAAFSCKNGLSLSTLMDQNYAVYNMMG